MESAAERLKAARERLRNGRSTKMSVFVVILAVTGWLALGLVTEFLGWNNNDAGDRF